MRRLLALCGLLALAAGSADAAAAERKPIRVLVYSGTEGFRHQSIPFGNAVIARMGRLTGRYAARFVDEPAQLTRPRLARADVVLWNNTTGAASPFTDAQEAAYVSWIRCGGGHVGVHASADSYKDWPAWAELTGAFFRVHPITPTSILDDASPEHEGWGEPEARILVADRTSAITRPWRGLDSFLLHDEFYAWDRDPAETVRGFRPLLAFGGFTDPATAARWDAEYAPEQPLAWTGSFRGRNRIYYTNLGHSAATWHRGDFQDALVSGIAYAGRERPARGCLRRAGIAR